MSDFTRYYATDIISDKTGALEVKTARFAVVAGTASQAVINAVTGKRIRILSAFISSLQSSAGAMSFLDGGNNIFTWQVSTGAAPIILIFNPAGWLETTASTGLNVAADLTNFFGSLRYVEVSY